MYLYSIYLDCDLRDAEFKKKRDAEQRGAGFRKVYFWWELEV
jgi:hypothetical protein